jgi:hypothetical protein
MSVTFENIRVEPFPFITLFDVQILQEPNSHPLALVRGLIDPKKEEDILLSADPELLVHIYGISGEDKKTLFMGVISEIQTAADSGNCTLRLLLSGASIRLDLQKGNRSFQNLSKTYVQILEETVGNDGLIIAYFEDKPLTGLEVRYKETKWEFMKNGIVNNSLVGATRNFYRANLWFQHVPI